MTFVKFDIHKFTMKDSLVAAGWIFSSIFFSTVLISLNKYITRTYQFDFMVSLTSFHFLFTFVLLEVMCRLGLFQRASSYPMKQRWLVAMYGVAAVVGMNFNLQRNSIGFYQLSKLCCIPTIVAYNLIVHKKRTPVNILVSLAVLLTGVGLYSVNDVEFNTIGCQIAAVSVLATAAFQISAGVDQGKYSMNGTQIQHATALPQFILCVIVAIITEVLNPSHSIANHPFTTRELMTILLTGVLAVGVNVSCFGIIGKTSALTYQVVGHVKTVLILLSGLLLFPPTVEVPRQRQIRTVIGMTISMVGIVLYSMFGMKNKAADEARKPCVFDAPKDTEELRETPLPPNLFQKPEKDTV